MFGGMAYKIGILAKKTIGGGGGDVTLNPTPDWADAMGGNPAETASETMQGIDTAITLRIIIVYSDASVEYRKNAGAWTQINSPEDVSMSNGDYIKFRNGSPAPGIYSEIQVYNYTDGNTLLDTIILQND